MPAKAPACEVGRLARAFQASAGSAGSASESAYAATKVHDTHGERDSHRIFRKFGLTLEVPVSKLEVEATADAGPMSLPHLKVSHYCKLLLRKYPQLLLGGRELPEGTTMLYEFWSKYRFFQPEHVVFSRFSQSQLGTVIPIMLHGDKGRGRAKLPILCASWETPFGLPKSLRDKACRAKPRKKTENGGKPTWSCGKRALHQRVPEVLDDSECPLKLRRLDEEGDAEMTHNARGTTFMSRFLCTAIPSKVFKAHPQVVEVFLRELKNDLTDLFNTGFQDDKGQNFYLAIIGVKGDYEWHAECAQFSRSYFNVGTTRSHEFCPDCLAGSTQVPAFDGAADPAWSRTLHTVSPWSSVPVLNAIPFSEDPLKGPSLYRKDPFHTLKYGLLKDVVASSIWLLCQLGFYDFDGDASKSIESRLGRAFSSFSLWLLAEGKSTTLRKFTTNNFHKAKATQHPFIGGKGSDSVTACMYLEFFTKLLLREQNPPHEDLLVAILETCQGALDFIGVYHYHGLFLSPTCGAFQLQSGTKLLRGYLYLAHVSLNMGHKLYALRPKVHFYAHILYDLKVQVERRDPAILNYSGIYNAEANEDFIGRISRISRKVSPKLASKRTIDRYLLACKLVLRTTGLAK